MLHSWVFWQTSRLPTANIDISVGHIDGIEAEILVGFSALDSLC